MAVAIGVKDSSSYTSAANIEKGLDGLSGYSTTTSNRLSRHQLSANIKTLPEHLSTSLAIATYVSIIQNKTCSSLLRRWRPGLISLCNEKQVKVAFCTATTVLQCAKG